MRYRVLLVAVAAFAIASAESALAGEESNLVDALVSQATAIRSLAADATVIERPGNGVRAYREARAEWAAWLKAKGRSDLADSVRADLKSLDARAAAGSSTSRYSYWVEPGRSIRVDRLALEPDETSAATVYAEGKTTSLTFYRGDEPARMTILNDDRLVWLLATLEQARNAGVRASHDLLMYEDIKAGLFAGVVDWGFLAKFVTAYELTDSSGISSKAVGPVLQISTPLFSNTLWPKLNMPLCRYEVVLASKANLAPAYLRCSHLMPHKDGKHQYVLDRIVEWSVPEFSQDGAVVFKKCLVRNFERVPAPDASAAIDDDTPLKSYETTQVSIQFDNVKINQPLTSDVFKLIPPEGSSVVDVISGESYIVGTAGEALQKTALVTRGNQLKPVAKPVSSFQIALLGINLLIFFSLVAFWLRRRWRPVA